MAIGILHPLPTTSPLRPWSICGQCGRLQGKHWCIGTRQLFDTAASFHTNLGGGAIWKLPRASLDHESGPGTPPPAGGEGVASEGVPLTAIALSGNPTFPTSPGKPSLGSPSLPARQAQAIASAVYSERGLSSTPSSPTGSGWRGPFWKVASRESRARRGVAQRADISSIQSVNGSWPPSTSYASTGLVPDVVGGGSSSSAAVASSSSAAFAAPNNDVQRVCWQPCADLSSAASAAEAARRVGGVVECCMSLLASVAGAAPDVAPKEEDLTTVLLETSEQRLQWRDFLSEAASKTAAVSLFSAYDVEAVPPRYARPPLSAPSASSPSSPSSAEKCAAHALSSLERYRPLLATAPDSPDAWSSALDDGDADARIDGDGYGREVSETGSPSVVVVRPDVGSITRAASAGHAEAPFPLVARTDAKLPMTHAYSSEDDQNVPCETGDYWVPPTPSAGHAVSPASLAKAAAGNRGGPADGQHFFTRAPSLSLSPCGEPSPPPSFIGVSADNVLATASPEHDRQREASRFAFSVVGGDLGVGVADASDAIQATSGDVKNFTPPLQASEVPAGDALDSPRALPLAGSAHAVVAGAMGGPSIADSVEVTNALPARAG